MTQFPYFARTSVLSVILWWPKISHSPVDRCSFMQSIGITGISWFSHTKPGPFGKTVPSTTFAPRQSSWHSVGDAIWPTRHNIVSQGRIAHDWSIVEHVFGLWDSVKCVLLAQGRCSSPDEQTRSVVSDVSSFLLWPLIPQGNREPWDTAIVTIAAIENPPLQFHASTNLCRFLEYTIGDAAWQIWWPAQPFYFLGPQEHIKCGLSRPAEI